MDLAHALERLPRRRLADQQVRLSGSAVRRCAERQTLVHRRIAASVHTAASSSSVSGRIAWYPATRGPAAASGSGLLEDRVGDRHRELADRPGLDHVAEVEQARRLAVVRSASGRPDQDVVVVGVVVDDAAGQPVLDAAPGFRRADARSAPRARGARDPQSLRRWRAMTAKRTRGPTPGRGRAPPDGGNSRASHPGVRGTGRGSRRAPAIAGARPSASCPADT